MILVYVPAGDFLMGAANSDASALANAQPEHTVFLDAFWIDRTDVTNKMYEACADAGGCVTPIYRWDGSRSSYYGNSQYDNYPMAWVNWLMARTYCEWAGRRLPTEAEWEKAARGTDGRVYPWGNQPPNRDFLNYGNVDGRDTTEVGRYPLGASPYGALDMEGNVWQWVSDYYSDTYYSVSPASNPLGPGSGHEHVLRGAGWSSGGDGFKSTIRTWDIARNSGEVYGFRCAMNASP